MEQRDDIGMNCVNLMEAHACFQEEWAGLGGKWRHLPLGSDAEAPEGWLDSDFDDRKWARALLPGDETGEGLYRRSFILSRDQGSRRILFRFAGMPEEVFLWVNGQFIGKAAGLIGEGEFDITDAVRTEKNQVCLRSSGPIREEPGLYTQPGRCITDIQPRLHQTGQGTTALALTVKARGAEGFTARIALMAEDKVLRYGEGTIEDGLCNVLLDCADVQLWSPETPAMYRIAVILWDGIAIHHTREVTLGLRKTEMTQEILTVNGRQERIHAAWYEAGSSSADDMASELQILRNHNFNGIILPRIASETLLGICDRIGLYVLERTGISRETHSEAVVLALTERLHALRSCHPSAIGWDLAGIDGCMVHVNPATPLSGSAEQSVCVSGSWRDIRIDGQEIAGYCGADGTLRPSIREAKAILAPMVCRFEDGVLTVENRNRFLSTGAFDGQLVLTRDGETAVSRPIGLDIEPGGQGSMDVETRYDIYKPGRYHLAAEFRRKSDGVLVARDQWEVGNLRHIYDENPGGTIRDEAGRILLRATDSSCTIDRSSGCTEQITVDGLNVLQEAMMCVFARPQSGIRIPDEWERFTARWKKTKPAVLEVDQMTRTVTASFRLGSGLMQTYRLFADGSVSVELRLRTGKTAPDRMGWQCALNPEVDQCRWFGLGPDGSDPEHRVGRYHGIHATMPDSPAFRDQVYSLTLTDQQGRGIRIRSEEGLRFSLEQGKNGNVLTLLAPDAGSFAPHTTYTFSLTICPVK